MKRCRCKNCRARTDHAFYAVIINSYSYEELMEMHDAWNRAKAGR